jgi:hypothetical protein
MPKRKVRLELWVVYDSEDGYVWPQVYTKEPDHLKGAGAGMNHPLKALRLRSEPYTFDDSRRASGSFGTEVSTEEERDAE